MELVVAASSAGYQLCVTFSLHLNWIDFYLGVKVDEDAGETGKKGFVNLKRIVWHSALHEILDTIKRWGKLGYHATCGDGIPRWLFPLLLILSSDFEEQYVFFTR
jgi:hypothetical protein